MIYHFHEDREGDNFKPLAWMDGASQMVQFDVRAVVEIAASSMSFYSYPVGKAKHAIV